MKIKGLREILEEGREGEVLKIKGLREIPEEGREGEIFENKDLANQLGRENESSKLWSDLKLEITKKTPRALTISPPESLPPKRNNQWSQSN